MSLMKKIEKIAGARTLARAVYRTCQILGELEGLNNGNVTEEEKERLVLKDLQGDNWFKRHTQIENIDGGTIRIANLLQDEDFSERLINKISLEQNRELTAAAVTAGDIEQVLTLTEESAGIQQELKEPRIISIPPSTRIGAITSGRQTPLPWTKRNTRKRRTFYEKMDELDEIERQVRDKKKISYIKVGGIDAKQRLSHMANHDQGIMNFILKRRVREIRKLNRAMRKK